MRRLGTDRLLEEYRATSVIHGQALQNGPTRVCNRAYDKLVRIRRELCNRGDIQRVRMFLDDSDVSVRCVAAADTLAFAPDDAVRVLHEIAAGPRGMVRLDAEMILQQWEAGEWDTKIS